MVSQSPLLVQLVLVRELMLPFDVDGRETFGRSFDFSNFPSLQEVGFGVHWERGGLPWIPTALATLGPATSPHLSVILLQFSRIWSTKTLIKVVGDDLQRVADEVTRIKSEFGEAVNIVVYRDSPFMVVLDTLNVRFRCCGLTLWSHRFYPTDPSGLWRLLKGHAETPFICLFQLVCL